MDPFPGKQHGINLYRSYFGEAVAHINADSRPFSKSIRMLALLEQPTLYVFARDASTSKDLAMMINTVKEANKHYEKVRKTCSKINS